MSLSFKAQHNGTIYPSSSRKCSHPSLGIPALVLSLIIAWPLPPFFFIVRHLNGLPLFDTIISGMLRHQGGTRREKGILRSKRSTQSHVTRHVVSSVCSKGRSQRAELKAKHAFQMCKRNLTFFQLGASGSEKSQPMTGGLDGNCSDMSKIRKVSSVKGIWHHQVGTQLDR